jgi:hypothetical protein
LPDINQAQPPLEFIPAQYTPWFHNLAKTCLPNWMRWKTAITKVDAENVELLANLYHEFQNCRIRLIFAFRHPKVEDPLCISYLLSHILPSIAKEKKIPLRPPLHTHFIYDRGIPLWAGSQFGWVLSHLGGTPIQRGKADWTGLRAARDLFVNGRFPMTAAPEGATNGLSEVMSPFEPGIAQLAFWCAEDLQKAGRNEDVVIVPIGIKYSYVDEPWEAIATLLSELEAATGLLVKESKEKSLKTLYPRLLEVAERFLFVMEDFYTRFYHQKITLNRNSENLPVDRNEAIAIRLQALLDTILKVPEEYFDLQAKGNLADRCRRVEQAGWNYIFREELKDEKSLSAVEKYLSDKVAEEANSIMWHMRLVESFVAVSGKYVKEKPTSERFAETTILIWDILTKIKGGNAFVRPILGKQQVKITIGEPLSLSKRYEVYKSSRLAARQAVGDLTKDLEIAMKKLL